MQSNGIMKSTALALEMSVSPAGALDALEKQRRQPKVEYCYSPSLPSTAQCRGSSDLPGTTGSSLFFSLWLACPTFSVFGRGGRRC